MSCQNILCKTVETTGFLCRRNSSMNSLVVTVDNELLMLTFDSTGNKFNVMWIDIDQKVPEFKELAECKEAKVYIDQLYSTKSFPRRFYIVFKVAMNGLEFYLLEFIDATYWLIILFYPCQSYEECIKKIETLKQVKFFMFHTHKQLF